MASRSTLYTRFRSPRTYQTEDTIRKINLTIFDIDFNHLFTIDQIFEIKIFNEQEVDLWFDYITSGIDKIYLFISNVISNIFLQSICEYPQVKSVYLFCKDQQYQDYSYEETKLRGIFHDVNTMFKQFQNDITELYDQIYSEKSTFQNMTPENGEILWWKFFDQILERIQHTNIAKDEFIEFSKEIYQNNKHKLREIEQFESTYTSDKAINSYTQDTFLYRLLNRTLRTQKNLNILFKLRLIVADLLSGLKTAQLDVHNVIHDPPFVYRGGIMTSEELQHFKSNIGNSIFVRSFLSTSSNRQVAEQFAGPSSGDSSTHSVLFTIQIDSHSTNTTRTPYANISNYSAHRVEEEILFSLHSTFLVESVKLDGNIIWNIDLKFMDNLWDTDFDQRSIFSSHADQIFIRHLSKENKQFIAFQLLLDMLLRLDQTKYAKDELLQFSRLKYQHNSTELKKIDDFEQNYQSKDAMKWYSKDSFLYRLLNGSLRIETIDSIVKMRYYIHDLHNQLAQLQPSSIQSLSGQKNLILYRGQTMKIDELNEIRENIGDLISMNSFLSATQDKDVAIAFSGDGQTTNPDKVSVIYEMLIDTNIRSTPYAKIDSVMEYEEEILFSMGSIFRIENVDELHDRMYSIKLRMEHIEDELWNKLTAHLD